MADVIVNIVKNLLVDSSGNIISSIQDGLNYRLMVQAALAAGSNTIGAVTQASGPWTQNLTQVGGSAVALGQALMAASFPVTIASNQSALAVSQSGSWTVTANAGTNLNTSALALDATLTGGTQQTKLTDGTHLGTIKAASTPAATTDTALVVAISPNNTIAVTQSTSPWVVSGTVTSNIGTTNGLALDTTLAKLTIAQGAALDSNTQALIGGSVTTAAPAYTTGQISPLSLTVAGLLRVDASATVQPVSQSGTWTTAPTHASTPTVTQVASSASSVTLLAANAARKGGMIYNDSTKILYVKFGATASTTSYTVQLFSQDYFEIPFNYDGRIDGIWSGVNGDAYCTEIT